MKNLLLIIALVLIFRLEANPFKQINFTDGSEDIHFVLYRVKTESKIDVLQIPSEERIILEHISQENIRIDSDNFNGVPVYIPINLDYSMTKKEICRALCESFNVSEILWFQGVMPRDEYLRIFPPDCFNKTTN